MSLWHYKAVQCMQKYAEQDPYCTAAVRICFRCRDGMSGSEDAACDATVVNVWCKVVVLLRHMQRNVCGHRSSVAAERSLSSQSNGVDARITHARTSQVPL
eukprot:TRINITY_DN2536_c0_g2_i2.p3 TRINITY_DN2536_c0_g2~~TRINITY_DN2536_c0_g2_i2.p3  ORF type:complete len:101 (+),score=13.60 TRINITY_DN2536_c0_g2_i2:541-843(+)